MEEELQTLPQPLSVDQFYKSEKKEPHISVYVLEKIHDNWCTHLDCDIYSIDHFCDVYNNHPEFKERGTIENLKMEWLNTEERKRYETSFNEEGKLYYKSDSFILSSNAGVRNHLNFVEEQNNEKEAFLLFVVSIDQKLYIAPYKQGKIQHSSIVAGEDVLSAGILTVKNGKIKELFFLSGHYKPNIKSVDFFLEFLKSKGAVFHEAFILSNCMYHIKKNIIKNKFSGTIEKLIQMTEKFERQKVLSVLSDLTGRKIKKLFGSGLNKELCKLEGQLGYSPNGTEIPGELVEYLAKSKNCKQKTPEPEAIFRSIREQ